MPDAIFLSFLDAMFVIESRDEMSMEPPTLSRRIKEFRTCSKQRERCCLIAVGEGWRECKTGADYRATLVLKIIGSQRKQTLGAPISFKRRDQTKTIVKSMEGRAVISLSMAE